MPRRAVRYPDQRVLALALIVDGEFSRKERKYLRKALVACGCEYFIGVLVLDHDDNKFEMHGISSLQDDFSEFEWRLRLDRHSLICA